MKLELTAADILMDLSAENKSAAIDEMVSFLCERNGFGDKASAIAQTVKEREELQSTGIGLGVGIPHAKTEEVDKLYIIAATKKEGLDFDSMDEAPAKIFFMLISPRSYSGPHVKALSTIAKLMHDAAIRSDLLASETAEEFAATLARYESMF